MVPDIAQSVGQSSWRELDFQMDLERYFQSLETDEGIEDYLSVDPDTIDVEEFFQQSNARKSGVLSPSGLYCPRYLYFGKTEMSAVSKVRMDSLILMYCGYILGKTFAKLAEAMYGGVAEHCISIPELGVFGHADFVLPHGGDTLVLPRKPGVSVVEFKTSSANTFQRSPDYYKMQLATYAKGVGADRAYLVVFWMDKRIFRTIRINIKEWWSKAKARFELANKHVELGVPPQLRSDNDHLHCRDCKFKHHCFPNMKRLLNVR